MGAQGAGQIVRQMVLRSLVSTVWTGLQLGLGAMLGDRWLPKRWSRALRWGMGMGLAGILPDPVTVHSVATGGLSGFASHIWSAPVAAWFVLRQPVMCALMGLALGWAASATRGRTWRLAGMGAGVRATVGLVSLGTSALYLAQMAQTTTAQVQTGLSSSHYWSVGYSAITGALVGLAFAAALSIGERRAQVSKPG